MADISVIIVTYNSGPHIEACLNSLAAQTSGDFELLIVDNNSSDDTCSIVRKTFASARLIINRENGGFSKAVNQGIERSCGEYVLVLNSDVVLREDFIALVNDSVSRLPASIAMVSPKILMADRRRIDSTGLVLSAMRRFYDRGRGYQDKGQFDNKPDIFGPCAAAALYRRAMLEDIKVDGEYFDEHLFMLLEDFDIAWRARRRGWKASYIPGLVCFHAGGFSRKKTPLCQYYSFRNRYLLLLKNAPAFEFLRLLAIAPAYEIPRLAFVLLCNRYGQRAIRDMRNIAPVMLKKRAMIRSMGLRNSQG